MTVVLASSLSLLSAIVVAVSSHLFSLHRKRTDDLAQMRLKAYTDFINAVAQLVSARRIGLSENEFEELVALNDAKIRICICGDSKVVGHLIEFWNAGCTLESESEIIAFTRLCITMRESLGNKPKEIDLPPLSDTLFKLEPSNFSFRESRG